MTVTINMMLNTKQIRSLKLCLVCFLFVWTDSRLHETPNLEDALRLVGGHTNHGSYGSHTAPPGYGNNALYQHEYSQSDNSLHRKYGMDSNGNTTAPSGYHGYSTQATATTYTSSQGRMPVKQFQQDLQEQQRKFLEEQAKSLQEFNEEIMKETTPTHVLERSDSLSSLDSLEEQPQRSSKMDNKDKENARYSVSKPSGPAVTANYYTQGHFSTSPSTKDHQKQTHTFHITELDSPQAKLFVSNQRTLDTDRTVSRDHQKPKTNGELKVEETSESDIVSEPVEDRKPMLLEGSSQHPRSSLPRSYADAVGSHYLTRTSEAWMPQSSYEVNYVNSGQSGISGISGQSILSGEAGHSSANVARTRQFSARTSATTFAVVPNTNGSNISHHATQQVTSSPKYTQQVASSPKTTQKIMSSPYRTKDRIGSSDGRERQRGVQFDDAPTATTDKTASSPYRTKERSSVREQQRGVQFDETPAAEKPAVDKPVRGENRKKLAKEPVSILKKTISSDQPAKLGGFKVRDSLEISKSSPGKKKSVRWTDVVEYEDDDGTAGAEKDSATVVGNVYEDAPSEESKDISMQHSRPMSGVNGRDNKAANTNGTQKDTSTKSRPQSSYSNSSYTNGTQKDTSKSRPQSSYSNSTYASSYASKKQTENPSSGTTNGEASKPVNAKNVQKKLSSGAGKSGNVTTGKNGAVRAANGTVRAANGLRLDKTPTDDEINWLWDKVRTCLNNRDEAEGEQAKVTERPPSGQHQPRQLASVTSQYIDGGRITANLRVPQGGAVAQSRNNGVPRWRTNSDSGSYLRRTALLHQRRQHSAISRGQGGGNGHPPLPGRQGNGHQQPVPASSHQGPTRTATMSSPNDSEGKCRVFRFGIYKDCY